MKLEFFMKIFNSWLKKMLWPLPTSHLTTSFAFQAKIRTRSMTRGDASIRFSFKRMLIRSKSDVNPLEIGRYQSSDKWTECSPQRLKQVFTRILEENIRNNALSYVLYTAAPDISGVRCNVEFVDFPLLSTSFPAISAKIPYWKRPDRNSRHLLQKLLL